MKSFLAWRGTVAPRLTPPPSPPAPRGATAPRPTLKLPPIQLCVFAALRLCVIFLLLLPAVPVNANGIPDRRFGVIESYENRAAATALGAGWTRITFEWNQIQPGGPGDWNEYPLSDAALDAEIAAGRELVGLIVATPGWASDGSRGVGVPNGLELPLDDPNNTWATFVRQLMTRHAGRIRHWIIWNEPDIWGEVFQSWGGSVEDFARMMKIAYLIGHDLRADMVIHMPAVTHWWDVNYGRPLFFHRFLQVITAEAGAAAHNYYFDAITLHLYFNPDTIYDLSRFYLGLMGEFGIYKPLWIVETNAAPSTDPAWPVAAPQFNVTLEDQAAFIIQAHAMALAGGAQRVAIYKLADTATDTANPEPHGLVRMDGSRRPAFTAYQVATRYLAGFQRATLDRRDDIGMVTVERADGWTTVLWARIGAEVGVHVPARAGSALLVDQRGQTRRLTPRDGVYTVTLPGNPCNHAGSPCLVGGPTYLLVEGSVPGNAPPLQPPTAGNPATATPVPPADANTPLPTATPALTVTATLRPTPTPSSTPTPSPTRTPRPTRTPTLTPSPTPSLTPSLTPSATAPPGQPSAISTRVSPPTPAPAPSPIFSATSQWDEAVLLLIVAALIFVWVRQRRR